jgi:hypothetical protein
MHRRALQDLPEDGSGPPRDLPCDSLIGDLKHWFVREAILIVERNRTRAVLCFDSPEARPLDESLEKWGKRR